MEQAWPRWLTIAGVAAASFHHRKIGGPQPAVVGVFPIPTPCSPPAQIGLAANVRPARLTVDCSRMNRIGSLELEKGAAVDKIGNKVSRRFSENSPRICWRFHASFSEILITNQGASVISSWSGKCHYI